MAYELIAAVDLGSNSFRLQVGRIVANQIYPLDGLKESVRLAAGLTPEKKLDAAAQQRGIDALSRFGERLRDFDPGRCARWRPTPCAWRRMPQLSSRRPRPRSASRSR
jgi:exopolyphosphatase/guanosine-5'-triphosphate,3'-diphosphate pyrophosphatase